MGRKAKETPNPLWEYLRHITNHSIRGMPSWMDDIIMGACYTSAGSSNGKLNINPALVRAAVFLPTISTAGCLNIYSLDKISERTARRVAQAARFALSGIQHHLDTHQEENEEMKKSWLMEKAFISSYYTGKKTNLHSPVKPDVPDGILQLYKDGKYLEYGEALREFRLNNK